MINLDRGCSFGFPQGSETQLLEIKGGGLVGVRAGPVGVRAGYLVGVRAR